MRCQYAIIAAIVLMSVGNVCASPVNPSVEFIRGETSYVVAVPRTKLEKRVTDRLTVYITKVLGKPVVTVRSLDNVPADAPAILLVNREVRSPVKLSIPKGSDEAFALTTAQVGGRSLVTVGGKTDKGLKRAVQKLIINSRQEDGSLVIPSMNLSEAPWIPMREWTVCPWEPSFVRGVFHNPYADKRFNLYLYDNERLSNYVEMFDWFGFSGAQIMETCYNYQSMGSIEAAQNWQKKTAGFLRDNGQGVTLWAWTAYFSGFGWSDPDAVTTPKPGNSAFTDPDVRRTFEQYYDRYAELAPYIDRFIGHFYDPGVLTEQSDVFNYIKLLEQKLKAKNPKVQMGIDGWASGPGYFQALVDNGFKDYIILPTGWVEAYPPGTREALHQKAKDFNLKLGVWGWYVTEYESDQIPTMHVNAQLMKDEYTKMRDGAAKVYPVQYWSEMEAYHLCNIFTMYACGQLLWNPDRDPHQVLDEICSGIWGPVNGPKVLRAVELIQDVRTGPRWETYWWTRPTYRLGTENPADDLNRAEKSLAELQAMKTDEKFVPKFPLPYQPSVFIELVIPHLKQIRQFAEFRVDIVEIEKAAANGAQKDQLENMLQTAWKPVQEYNTWVGTFGPPEVKRQKEIVASLKAKYNLNVKDPDSLRYIEADRLLEQFRRWQSGFKTALVFTPILGGSEFFWLEETTLDRFDKLVQDGLVTKVGDNQCQLTDWENWAAR
ncbi:MAG: hypothetical protein ACYC27_09325 [Armatimonadota bacterium]